MDFNDQDPTEIKNLMQNARNNALNDFKKEKQQTYLTNKRRNSIKNFTDQQEVTARIELSEETKARLKEEHDKFFAYLDQRDFDGLIKVIEFLRESISSKTDPLPGGIIHEMEMISPLLNLLSDDFSDKKLLQTEVAWLLANVSAGNSKDTQVLVEMNVIPVMARALCSTINDDLDENIMWTLANISGESNLLYRDQILEQGVLNMIVKEIGLRPKEIVYYRIAAWLISNLVRGEPFPPFKQIERVFGALIHLIDYPDEAIQQYTLLSLAYLTEEAKKTHLKSISENGFVTKIVQFISSKDEKIAINAVKVAGNLAKGKKHLIHNLYDYEIFKALPKILESTNSDLRKNACLMLSEMMSNEFDDHDYINDYDVLESLIKLAAADEENDIRAQATFCLQKYIESATNEFAMIAVEKGAVEAFLQNLQGNDEKVIENSLVALSKALEHGENMKDQNGGINFIVTKIMENGMHQLVENLQKHPNEDIALKAELSYRKFFQKDF